jgi:hypothetical protein
MCVPLSGDIYSRFPLVALLFFVNRLKIRVRLVERKNVYSFSFVRIKIKTFRLRLTQLIFEVKVKAEKCSRAQKKRLILSV